jgi:tRNA (guanine37-N1)-methyltransferase
VDQRVVDLYADMEVSVGDYVLNGGEVPAMVLIEAIARFIPGFLGHNESTLDESHSSGLLEYPLYTRPRVWRNVSVPKILVSGNHAQVAAFRLAEAVAKTRIVRPELLDDPKLDSRLESLFERPGSPLASKKNKTASRKPKDKP